MNWGDRIEQAGTSLVTYVVVSFAGAVAWLVRRVLTNQKQIEMLQREIEHRDKQRNEDRELIADTREDVKAIRNIIMGRGK